jgi:hypothetical protein
MSYKDKLPEFDSQAVIVASDLLRKSRKRFTDLVAQAGSYSENDIESQTRAKKLKILSDINDMLSLIGCS